MFNQARRQFAALPLFKPEERGVYRHIVITLSLCLVGIMMVYAAIYVGEFTIVSEAGGAVLGLVLLVQAWRNWKTGVQSLLVIIVVEGAVRKWFMPSYAELVYFYKDVLMGATVVSYWMTRDKAPLVIKYQMRLFLGVVAAFSLYVLAVVVNPSAPHIVTSLMGVKVYCLYVPLVWMIPRAFPTKEKLVVFLRWYLVIALGVVAIAVWQFMDGNTASSLNRYAWADPGVVERAVFADSSGTYYLRVTSTFSFISGFTVYLPVTFALLLGLTSLRSSRSLPLKIRWLYYAAMGGIVTASFMTGSRAVILSLAATALSFYAFTSLKEAMRRARQLLIGAVLIFLTITAIAPQVLDAMYTRAFGGEAQIEEGRERIAEIFSIPFEAAGYAGAFGYGVGATQNGLPALMNRLGLEATGESIPIAVEGESSRVMLELGIMGFLLFSLVRLGVVYMLWRACVTIRSSEHKSLAVAAFAGIVFPVVAGGAVVNHTQNVYQWFLVGMGLALLNADKLARQKQALVPAGERQDYAMTAMTGTLLPAAPKGGVAT